MAMIALKKLASVEELERIRRDVRERLKRYEATVVVCGGTGCTASGCSKVATALENGLVKRQLDERVRLLITGCHGFCERGPLVVIRPQGVLYQRVQPKDVDAILDETLIGHKVIEKLCYVDPQTKKRAISEDDVAFYNRQQRIIFGWNGLIDPQSIEDYIAIGGYSALAKVLFEMEPEAVVEMVKKSGLRGRGGAGFPTGVKWESVAKAHGDTKYVICNADEGDPGAYANRSLMEGNPHSVLEGMIIGAYAMGANEGYVYVRTEYPMAVELITRAVEQAQDYGLLGDNILGTGFAFSLKMFKFKVRVNRGGGAFVCGESSALMASIEGRAGEPRPKHVHMAEKGLWDRPTCLNNVETWANVPLIINRGLDWYTKVGTGGSKGTKIFSLVGKINNTGLVEVPMGLTLREIIQDIGGGIRGGRSFKAVQTGGPSGGCIPKDLVDLKVDFDELTKAGSMMGSGGMIVMDDRTCMVDVAKYFVAFLKDESCGKCVPCREGLIQMHHILTRITNGEGTDDDIPLLQDLADVVAAASLCQLGGT
ncbi:MAG: NADH-quinone oxidoreductase subunit F, partial [Planctomycetes bacterium]|nr:NADH-quinone oxidoreductase subunit F [Planctomycetota bacterium]